MKKPAPKSDYRKALKVSGCTIPTTRMANPTKPPKPSPSTPTSKKEE